MADKVAVITGAAGGIGQAVAHRLGNAGYQLALLDTAADALAGLRRELLDQGRAVTAYEVDVTRFDAVQRCVATIEDEAGPIDGLVNAAGVMRPAALESISEADWSETFAVNAFAVMHVLRAVVPRMAARGSGAVVTVSSNAAHTPRIGLGTYAASKAAALMLTKCVGLEYAQRGVRVNVVCPGSTDTAMLRTLAGPDAVANSVRGDQAAFKLGIPLGRIATPDRVAAVIAFLLSDDAGHITLESVTVDGGATLGVS
jgi:2,3-dihydro-2,3-dihydroxybenzoate dehydrogenase